MFIQKFISVLLLTIFGFLSVSFFFDGLYGLATINATTTILVILNSINHLWTYPH
jgi:uncharacterized membrane protein YqjE